MKRKLLHILFGLFVTCCLFVTFIYTYKLGDAYIENFMQRIQNQLHEIVDEKEDSKVQQDKQVYDAMYYPYYAMLEDDEKVVYEQMVTSIENMQTTFVPSVAIYEESIQKVYEAVLYEHPALFWVDNAYTFQYMPTGEVVEITVNFNDTVNQIEENKNAFDAQCNSIIQNALVYTNDLDRERYIHDALRDLLTYDINASYNQSAYSAFVNHRTVCAGYAKAFQLIIMEVGIPCYYVTGSSEGEEHAWNIVYIDGEYRNVDVTWDDTSYDAYQFFNFVDANTHQRSESASLLPVCA